MISIAYASEETVPFSQSMLEELYENAAKKNRRLGLTGYLSSKNGHFFQYLEGPENSINDILHSISNDSRHKILQLVQLGSIEQRRFAQWDLWNISGVDAADIRIQDLIEDVIKSASGDVFAESEMRRIIMEMLDKMSQFHRDNQPLKPLTVSDSIDIGDKPPFVVALGASAGGLNPLQSIVRSLDPKLDAAFVIVQHFSPDTETVMDMILQRDTTMTVCSAEENMKIEPSKIYVIPPGENLEVSNNQFKLSKQQRLSRGPQFPIDICFRSIAREYGDRAIAVVLSGTGTDGARGAKVLNEAGGVVLVQSPESAEFDGMPNSSIESGMAHQILTPTGIADFINQLSKDYVPDTLELLPQRRAEYVNEIVGLLAEHDIDFSQYKNETLFRRIERRRVLAHITSSDDYVEFVQSSEQERNELREDILITVTSFFRDEAAWQKLKDSIIPLIATEFKQQDTFRVWVAACATGEEAYTVGMVLTELLEKLDSKINFKVYATDIERKALETASAGWYSERALASVSPERRNRFFTRKADGYMINREIRENVIFAPHNFVKNAPFTRMHLVTCRNVLIYMQPELQQTAIKMLHFALNVNGILFLGPSETLGNLQSEFYPVQREWNQYKKLRNLRLPLHLSMERFRKASSDAVTVAEPLRLKNEAKANGIVGLSLDALSQHTGSTNVLVDTSRSVMMVISDPSGILRVQIGEPTLDVTRMVPESLCASLTFAIARAFKEHKKVVHRSLPCQPIGQDERVVDLEVMPHVPSGEPAAQYALVVISESIIGQAEDTLASDPERNTAKRLRLELEETKKALQSAITDLETSDHEQRSINEQLSAANEELQSTNEELQSVNEELYTVNFEYQTKIHELSDLNHDLDNLLDSTKLGVIFLDSDLCIRRFTDEATQTVNLLPSDVGRPFVDLANNLQYEDLIDDMRQVLATSKSIDREIARQDSDLLQVDIHPYRAGGDIAEGVLVMFRNVNRKASVDDREALPEPL